MMKIVKFQFNMFGENCYVVYDPATRQAMVVDPGMLTEAERQAIDDFIAREQLIVKYLVNTHLHLDHSFGNAHISDKYGVKTKAHAADIPLGANLRRQAEQFGIFDAQIAEIGAVEPLSQGDVLTLGNDEIRVIHTPGHTPGSIALYAPADGWVITGDSLFAGGGIGRTDLPGGNQMQLIDSLKTKLFTLPGETKILPGHGPVSTIADETF
ncbi:MAG: MBL fold metallo-hydrolase [Muribaculaceae bacterium]|nr:MBL fold metallo-hydrolase [Muribaculaceae bacterium]